MESTSSRFVVEQGAITVFGTKFYDNGKGGLAVDEGVEAYAPAVDVYPVIVAGVSEDIKNGNGELIAFIRLPGSVLAKLMFEMPHLFLYTSHSEEGETVIIEDFPLLGRHFRLKIVPDSEDVRNIATLDEDGNIIK